jgi:Arc/MetJ-type ribon-helix-helix transcriptional regulator
MKRNGSVSSWPTLGERGRRGQENSRDSAVSRSRNTSGAVGDQAVEPSTSIRLHLGIRGRNVACSYDGDVISKERLSASVDTDLIEAGRAAVADGRYGTLSEWVNEALRRQSEHDSTLAVLQEFIADWEAEHGSITDDEMMEATRRARSRAVIVRGRAQRGRGRGKGAA